MRPHRPCAQQHNVVTLFLPLEIRLHRPFSLLMMASEKTSDAAKPPSPKRPRTETAESIASLNIGDLRSLIRDTVLDVVKATSSEGMVPEAGGSGSSATKGDSGKLARVAGRSKSMSIGGSEVACGSHPSAPSFELGLQGAAGGRCLSVPLPSPVLSHRAC